MRAIKLSWKLARVLRDFVDGGERRNHAELLSALDAALKPKRSVTAARKVRTRKRQTRKERFAEIREAVLERADGRCECGDGDLYAWNGPLQVCHGPLQVDHFFGGSNRRALESVETCWALAVECHRLKTANEPSAKCWLENFIDHVERQAKLLGDKPGAGNYLEAARMARARLDALRIQEGRT